ncbi:MAG: Gfo/Idh/MocA family protein [Burkholderiales bacterium]
MSIRYAVVQGYISQVAVLPAFEHAKENSTLSALISGDSVKLDELSKKYGVERCYSYDQYDECLESGEIDAVYIALPNHMHREYAERAARAGIHVLCEKPMAVTSEDCETMIAAAEENGVKLMIAYRLHFEEANLKAIEMVKAGQLGEPRIFSSDFCQQVTDEDNIRLNASDAGGGPVYDMGVYCINAARYLFQDEPVEVFACMANNGEKRFAKCEEMASAVMRFPNDRLATFTCSFGAADAGTYRIIGTKGDLRMDDGYEYVKEIKQQITIEGKKKEIKFEKRDQFAPELVYFSDCVLNDKDPEPSGEEGLADVRVIEAIYESARSARPVKLGAFERVSRPSMRQEMKRPPVRKPDLVHASSPSS